MRAASFFYGAAALLPLVNAQAVQQQKPNLAWGLPDGGCGLQGGYWPAAVAHIEGSSWVRSNTATAGIEKQWECRLGSVSDNVIPDRNGLCFVTTANAAGSTTVDTAMPVGTCFVMAHSVVVAVTAGLEKVEAVHPIITQVEDNPSALLSYWSE
ncbi:hypothetical protein LZ31DRAFT_594802 [Colletotrichum somersetense]|nr:hypothetical protein LZ31DRAFT_594802 [Colletotrichum somersetense]